MNPHKSPQKQCLRNKDTKLKSERGSSQGWSSEGGHTRILVLWSSHVFFSSWRPNKTPLSSLSSSPLFSCLATPSPPLPHLLQLAWPTQVVLLTPLPMSYDRTLHCSYFDLWVLLLETIMCHNQQGSPLEMLCLISINMFTISSILALCDQAVSLLEDIRTLRGRCWDFSEGFCLWWFQVTAGTWWRWWRKCVSPSNIPSHSRWERLFWPSPSPSCPGCCSSPTGNSHSDALCLRNTCTRAAVMIKVKQTQRPPMCPWPHPLGRWHVPGSAQSGRWTCHWLRPQWKVEVYLASFHPSWKVDVSGSAPQWKDKGEQTLMVWCDSLMCFLLCSQVHSDCVDRSEGHSNASGPSAIPTPLWHKEDLLWPPATSEDTASPGPAGQLV